MEQTYELSIKIVVQPIYVHSVERGSLRLKLIGGRGQVLHKDERQRERERGGPAVVYVSGRRKS